MIQHAWLVVREKRQMKRSKTRLTLLAALACFAVMPVAADDILDTSDIDKDLQSGVRDMFPGELFPADGKDTTAPSSSVSANSQTSAQQKMAQQLQYFQLDTQLRSQMDRVGSWLTEFGQRNQGRFPGVETGDSWGLKRNATVQLTELVGNNPYAGASNIPATAGELNGLSPGLQYFYNANGSPITGSPIASDEWTSELTAEKAGRINLQMDYGLTAGQIDSYRNDPPSNWEAAPGTITALGNGQGFFAVWGAGHDGKPITEGPNSKRPYVIAQSVQSTVDDQNAPNEK